MHIEMDIPTPKACVDCPFHTIDTNGRYGKWIMKCLIDSTIKMEVREGLMERYAGCPGLEKENK